MRWDHISIPDWRDEAAYEGLLEADRACFAWEWLRRDPDYRTAAIRASGVPGAPHGADRPERWGLHAFENPGLTWTQARPMWTAARYPKVLRADASPARSAAQAFDLRNLSGLARLLRGRDGREHLMLGDGLHIIRLDICSGSIARGRADLHFRLEGPHGVPVQVLTLRRLLALIRTGRFSPHLHRPDASARRWLRALRTADALAAGASQRDIAVALLGLDPRQNRWRAEAPNLRGKAQRLVQRARRLASGGYAEFLE